MASSRLERFKDAQGQQVSGFQSALSEIHSGGKRSHWIWYVFPQLSGMGYSAASRTYGIDGVREAEEYLRDPILRSRLLEIASAVAGQIDRGVTLMDLMDSSIDVTKLVSSMTLFERIAERLHEAEGLTEYASLVEAARKILERAAAEGHPPCQFTLNALANQ
jgi:uncharacterized protein (DUF1810 family)